MSRRAANENDLLLTIQFATLELKLHNFIRALERSGAWQWNSRRSAPCIVKFAFWMARYYAFTISGTSFG